MHNILLVEDEEAVSNYYSAALIKAGFNIITANNSTTALQHFEQSQIDLILLDISLGDDTEAGFHICTKIRSISERMPIIFLTSHDDDIDRISGIRLGADDYITKETNINFLIVRIEALLHRISVLTAVNDESNKANIIESEDLYINMDTLKITWKKEPVKLNLTQLWIVHELVSSGGYVRTTQQLMDAAHITVQPSTIVVQIKNVRNLFLEIDPKFSAIKNERGIGYRWLIED